MNGFKRGSLIVLITTLITMVSWAGSCFAESQADVQENQGQLSTDIEAEYAGSDTPLDNDELFDKYVESLFADESSSLPLLKRRAPLTGANLAIYEKIKPEIAMVARGSRTSTVFTVSIEQLGLEKNGWTAKELGIDSIVEDGEISQEAVDAMLQEVNVELGPILNALIADCPFELYWYDKVRGAKLEWIGEDPIQASIKSGEWVISLSSKVEVELSFTVAQGYAASNSEGSYKVATTNMTRVNHAVNKAAAIVDSVRNKTDCAKLKAYRTAICDLTGYDDKAAYDASTSYGDPWQLVSVFDEDTNTNVVCEGYSKAFQYLCSLTTFEDDISCISVSGDMAGGTGQGPHMWNIVNMEDGKNYLVDVTNCDEGTIGAPDDLFLAGYYSGSVSAGYTFRCSGGDITYVYDSDTKATYDTELVISGEDYKEALEIASGTFSDDLEWSLLSNGRLMISGSSEMAACGSYSAPWYGYRGSITLVRIAEGVTSIGEGAFMGCTEIEAVHIPPSVVSIGAQAFQGSNNVSFYVRRGSYADSFLSQENRNIVYTCDYGHIWSGGYTVDAKATCISEGSESRHCLECGVSNMDSARTIAKLSHKLSDWKVTRAATCGTDGVRQRVCANCDYLEKAVIPATGKHTFGEWKTTKQPTADEEGTKERVCSVCGKRETELVDKLPADDRQSGQDSGKAENEESSKPKEAAVKTGDTVKYSKNTYKVLSAKSKTVAFTKAYNKTSVTVPATIKAGGKTYKVTQINAKAFKGSKIRMVTIGKNVKTIKKNAFAKSKATKLIVKTKLLKKSKVKGCLKGSKIKTVQVKVSSRKSVNRKYVKIYKKHFTKTNAGRKAAVK